MHLVWKADQQAIIWITFAANVAPTHSDPESLDDAVLILLARRVANFTQDAWAREVGVRPATVWRWEHGQRRLTDRDRTMVRLILRTPELRRRVHLNEPVEKLLIAGKFVEPMAASVVTYRHLRTFLREANLLP